MQLNINDKLDGNTVKKPLGDPGSYAIAYEVENLAHTSTIVLKLFNKEGDQDAEKRFYQENEVLRELSPHERIIAPLSEAIKSGLYLYYLMEQADCTLHKYYLDKNQKFDLLEIKKIAVEVCEGLQCAHTKKIIHRDLHTKNVLIKTSSGMGDVKLSDFGLAKNLNILNFSDIPGQLWGALLIKPPEFYFNICDVSSSEDYQSGDIYAIGIILFFLFNGIPTAHPFRIQSDVITLLSRNNVDPLISSLAERTNAYAEWLQSSAGSFFNDLQINNLQDMDTMKKANNLVQKLCNPDFTKRPTDFDTIIAEIEDL